MKNMIFVFFVLIALFISPLYSQHKVIKIWPGLAPGTEGRENNEKITNGSVTNVYQPDLTIFLMILLTGLIKMVLQHLF